MNLLGDSYCSSAPRVQRGGDAVSARTAHPQQSIGTPRGTRCSPSRSYFSPKRSFTRFCSFLKVMWAYVDRHSLRGELRRCGSECLRSCAEELRVGRQARGNGGASFSARAVGGWLPLDSVHGPERKGVVGCVWEVLGLALLRV